MAVASQGLRSVPYCRRHPEQTALYQIVQQHLETYLALAGEDDWNVQRVPAYVEREFRRYLECGILAYGFACARCPECGHDFPVAFSCKGWGLCPSCNARRLAETAAHLVDTEMACVCGIHYMTWSKWEKGEQSSPVAARRMFDLLPCCLYSCG